MKDLPTKTESWDLLVGHYLGIGPCGVLHSVDHPEMHTGNWLRWTQVTRVRRLLPHSIEKGQSWTMPSASSILTCGISVDSTPPSEPSDYLCLGDVVAGLLFTSADASRLHRSIPGLA
jgi:hypothetical protein